MDEDGLMGNEDDEEDAEGEINLMGVMMLTDLEVWINNNISSTDWTMSTQTFAAAQSGADGECEHWLLRAARERET